MTPASAIPLAFDAADQQRAWDRHGSNCGPGAIAGLAGLTPETVVTFLGERFRRIGGTTEYMLADALEHFAIPWRDSGLDWPDYGLVRIQWDGPWLWDPRPFHRLRHSHWVGSCREGDAVHVFDINAISRGGWLSLDEWSARLVPWLLERAEPQATGTWWINDAYDLWPAGGRPGAPG